jgi:hypothetical protein
VAPQPWRSRFLPTLAGAVLGCLLAAIIVFLSPGNEIRSSAISGSLPISDVFTRTVGSASRFVLHAWADPFILGTALLTFILARIGRLDRTLPASDGVIACGIILMAACVGAILTYVPGYYSLATEPPPRVLPTATISVMASAIAIGYVGSSVCNGAAVLQERLVGQLLPVMAMGLLLVISLPHALARASDRSDFQHWAASWDDRDALFRQARAQGHMETTLEAENDFFLGGLGTDTTSWRNVCLADYYGLKSVTVTLVPSKRPAS